MIEYNYDSSKSYAISVTSKFSSEECELIELTLDNNASNIINNKSFDEKGTVDLENIYSLDELFIYLDFTFAGDSLNDKVSLFIGKLPVLAPLARVPPQQTHIRAPGGRWQCLLAVLTRLGGLGPSAVIFLL